MCVSASMRPVPNSLQNGKYELESEHASLTAEQFADKLAGWVTKYPIITLEDCCGENDWAGWETMTKKLGKKIQIVGDDIFVTNTKILRAGHQEGRRQFYSYQGQSDRHPERDPKAAIAMARRAGYTSVIRTARARPRTRLSPISPLPPAAGRSRPARCRAPTAWRNTTNCCALREEIGVQARYPGRRAFPMLKG